MTSYFVTGRPTSMHKARQAPYNLVLADTDTIGSIVTASLGTADENQLIAEGIIALTTPPAVAAAGTISLSQKVSLISGAGTIQSIAGGVAGRELTLIFQAGAVVVDNLGNCRLNGTFTATADDILELAYDGANWCEKSRSAN